MRKKLLLLSICLSSLFCARQNASITEEELVVNQLLSNIINAGNPNALDKIVFSRSQADGSFITQINATNLDFYIYFQFEGNRQIPFSDKDGRTWDVAFNRYKLATNSGETNRFGSGGACKSNRGSVADAVLLLLKTKTVLQVILLPIETQQPQGSVELELHLLATLY